MPLSENLAARVAGKIQLTTDGIYWYEKAVRAAFPRGTCDYAQVVKKYGNEPNPDMPATSRRYSPCGLYWRHQDSDDGRAGYGPRLNVLTSNGNLSIHTSVRRMTRLTNGFSNKAENHAHAFALHTMHFNYCHPHGSLTKNALGRRRPRLWLPVSAITSEPSRNYFPGWRAIFVTA